MSDARIALKLWKNFAHMKKLRFWLDHLVRKQQDVWEQSTTYLVAHVMVMP